MSSIRFARTEKRASDKEKSPFHNRRKGPLRHRREGFQNVKVVIISTKDFTDKKENATFATVNVV